MALPLFIFTLMFGGFAATEYEACKEEGIDAKACFEKVIDEREPLDYSKLND